MASMNLNVGVKGLKNDTTIGDVQVPDALRHRKKIGISWFDDALGGEGIVPSTSMMLTGTPGAGKSTLFLQAADAIVNSGHICLYNTGEESLYQTKMVYERLGLKNKFHVGQHTLIENLLNQADHLRKTHPKKQVFIFQDSLQTLDDGKWADGPTSKTPLTVTEMLTNWSKDTYGIVCFIGQVNKDGEFQGKNGILHAIDVRARIYIDEQKKSETYGERIFEVTKNRFGVSGRAYVLGMGKKGLYEKGCLFSTSSVGDTSDK